MEALLGATRAEMGFVFGLATVTLTVGMNFAPQLYRRLSPVTLALACGLTSGLGLVLAASASGFTQFALGYGVLFGPGAGVLFIVSQQAVNQTVVQAPRPRQRLCREPLPARRDARRAGLRLVDRGLRGAAHARGSRRRRAGGVRDRGGPAAGRARSRCTTRPRRRLKVTGWRPARAHVLPAGGGVLPRRVGRPHGAEPGRRDRAGLRRRRGVRGGRDHLHHRCRRRRPHRRRMAGRSLRGRARGRGRACVLARGRRAADAEPRRRRAPPSPSASSASATASSRGSPPARSRSTGTRTSSAASQAASTSPGARQRSACRCSRARCSTAPAATPPRCGWRRGSMCWGWWSPAGCPRGELQLLREYQHDTQHAGTHN